MLWVRLDDSDLLRNLRILNNQLGGPNGPKVDVKDSRKIVLLGNFCIVGLRVRVRREEGPDLPEEFEVSP